MGSSNHQVPKFFSCKILMVEKALSNLYLPLFLIHMSVNRNRNPSQNEERK